MRVNGISFGSEVLRAECSGQWGIGSEGNSSCQLLTAAIERWMEDHPAHHVSTIEVDYRAVDFRWGDGPVSSLVPFFGQRIESFRLVASPANKEALLRLIQTCQSPGFEVVDPGDA